MAVAINQSGNSQAPLEVDNLCLLSHECLDILILADSYYVFSLYCQGFHFGIG